MKDFCTPGCGICCRHIGGIKDQVKDYINIEDETCEHLDDDGLCRIYENKPFFCDSNQCRPDDIEEDEWERIQLEACRMMKEHYGDKK